MNKFLKWAKKMTENQYVTQSVVVSVVFVKINDIIYKILWNKIFTEHHVHLIRFLFFPVQVCFSVTSHCKVC